MPCIMLRIHLRLTINLPASVLHLIRIAARGYAYAKQTLVQTQNIIATLARVKDPFPLKLILPAAAYVSITQLSTVSMPVGS